MEKDLHIFHPNMCIFVISLTKSNFQCAFAFALSQRTLPRIRCLNLSGVFACVPPAHLCCVRHYSTVCPVADLKFWWYPLPVCRHFITHFLGFQKKTHILNSLSSMAFYMSVGVDPDAELKTLVALWERQEFKQSFLNPILDFRSTWLASVFRFKDFIAECGGQGGSYRALESGIGLVLALLPSSSHLGSFCFQKVQTTRMLLTIFLCFECQFPFVFISR